MIREKRKALVRLLSVPCLLIAFIGFGRSQVIWNDPAGDAKSFSHLPPYPDILHVTGGYTDTHAVFMVDVAPGTLDPADFVFSLYLDTDGVQLTKGVENIARSVHDKVLWPGKPDSR